MRLHPLLLIAGLAAFAAPAASAAAADCGCQIRHPAPVRHVRRVVHVRHHFCAPPIATHVREQHYGYIEHGEVRSERSVSEQHSWSQGGWEMAFAARRPWATDRHGYLTWPGKTHFVDGQPVFGPVGRDGADRRPPYPPMPPPDMQPPPDAGDGYEINRF
jgi:hypothetical protein